MSEIKQLFKEIFDSDTDPVKRCPVYLDKEHGSCSHVDGPLCDWPDCSMVEKYGKVKAAEEIICPVCGYYCLGKGGNDCIDKPTYVELTKKDNLPDLWD
jgi:hypothetical protein